MEGYEKYKTLKEKKARKPAKPSKKTNNDDDEGGSKTDRMREEFSEGHFTTSLIRTLLGGIQLCKSKETSASRTRYLFPCSCVENISKRN